MALLGTAVGNGLRVGLAALLAALFFGCAHRPQGGQLVIVKGELAAGPECLMITAKSGRKYSLTGNPGRFKIGDRVCIRGRIVEASICMEGEATVSIQAIGDEDVCP